MITEFDAKNARSTSNTFIKQCNRKAFQNDVLEEIHFDCEIDHVGCEIGYFSI